MKIIKHRSRTSQLPVTMAELLERFFNDSIFDNTQVSTNFTPGVDLIESDKAYEIHFAVPGFDKDNFNIEVKDNVLTVSGERKFEEQEGDKTFKLVQTSYGRFERSFTLPENVNVDKIEAHYNNGMLEVVIPKTKAKELKTSIKVK